MADKLGAELAAFVACAAAGDLSETLIAHGADRVYVAEHPELAAYRTLPYRRVLIDLIAAMETPPHIVLFGSTTTGRDLARASPPTSRQGSLPIAPNSTSVPTSTPTLKIRAKSGSTPTVFMPSARALVNRSKRASSDPGKIPRWPRCAPG